MSDPSGGNQGAFLEGLGALFTSIAAIGAFLVSLRRRKPADAAAVGIEVKAALLDIRQDALDSHDSDYRRQTHRVHQLEDFISAHNLPVPPRTPDE